MNHTKPPIVCAISASDGSAHAGNQCDLRVIQDLDCHGTSVLTGITAQNSQTITAVEPPQDHTFSLQLEALVADLPIATIKSGLLLSANQVDTLIEILSPMAIPLVVDPVLSTSSGKQFDSETLISAYDRLLPIVELFTPNIPEAQRLLKRTINSDEETVLAAQCFRKMGAKSVLIKGGHRDKTGFVFDYFDDGKHRFWLRHKRQNSNNTRGTGCVLSAAAASFMAQGKDTVDAVVLASAYVQQGIRYGFALGKGHGLLANQGWPKHLRDYPQIAPDTSVFDTDEFPSCDTKSLGLYPIVDSIDWLEKLLKLGVATIQLRIKSLNGAELETVIHKAVSLGKQYDTRLFINDHWPLAIKHKAYGVHLGQEDMNNASLDAIRSSGLRLGLSSHSEYEWIRAISLKPSYIAMGSVFTTNTKSVKTIGLDNLQQWVEVLGETFSTVAIGGITEGNIEQVMKCGVGSCAVISTITKSEDYKAVTLKLIEKLETRN